MKTEIEDGSRRPTTNYDHYEVIDDGFTLLTRGKQTGDPAVLQVCHKHIQPMNEPKTNVSVKGRTLNMSFNNQKIELQNQMVH